MLSTTGNSFPELLLQRVSFSEYDGKQLSKIYMFSFFVFLKDDDVKERREQPDTDSDERWMNELGAKRGKDALEILGPPAVAFAVCTENLCAA